MPFLKITRDKRGYENTCVMHSARRRGRAGARILYWFRSPPDVKVGRGPLDEEAIRLIEKTHPGVRFDWAQMLKTASAEKKPSKAKTAGGQRGQRQTGRREAADTVPPAPAPGQPSYAAGGTGAAEAVLGSSGLARLRVLYAELLTRIAQRVSDQNIQAGLRAEAESLDPDTWVTEEDVRQRLETFEASFGALRARLGGGRRRSRRGGAGRRRRHQAPRESTESAGVQQTTPVDDEEPQS